MKSGGDFQLFLPVVGFDTEHLGSAVWKGGETEALARLDRHLERKVGSITSRVLSTCLCVSVRAITLEVDDIETSFLIWWYILTIPKSGLST